MTFSFVIAWNEFVFALTFITNQDLRPLTTGIFSFVGRYDIQWQYLMAASILSIIPVFLLVSAWLFPLGTMFYWLVSNVYTLVQQLIIINKLPTPGSDTTWRPSSTPEPSRRTSSSTTPRDAGSRLR